MAATGTVAIAAQVKPLYAGRRSAQGSKLSGVKRIKGRKTRRS